MTKINQVKEYWEKHPTRGHWNTYEDEMAEVYIKEKWMPDTLNKLNINNKLILDIGSGQGTNLYYLLKNNSRAYGFDISQTAIKSSKDKIKKGGFNSNIVFLGNAEKIPIKPNTFDCAISLGVLHHTSNITKAADEIHKLLKPNSKACLMLYKKNTIQDIIIKTLRNLNTLSSKLSNNKISLFKIIKPNKKKNYGTFFHELLTCPILNTYSKNEIRSIFNKFNKIEFETKFTGLTRVKDFIPLPKSINKLLYLLETKVEKWLGFYQIIYLTK